MEKIIKKDLFRNAIIFLNEAIHHFNLGIQQIDNKILVIVNLQISLELSMKYTIVNYNSVSMIFDDKNISNISDEEIIAKYLKNNLKVKEYDKLKNYLKSDIFFSSEFSNEFSYMEKFQKYRNKLLHLNYNFNEEEESQIEFDIIHIIVRILYRLLSGDISSSDYNDYLYEYIPDEEYKILLSNKIFAEEIKLKFEAEYGKLYICPICGSRSLTPKKKCYRCLNDFSDSNLFGYVMCNYCGEEFVLFDAANIDINDGSLRGMCLNCEEDTIVFKCLKCKNYYNTEAFGREMCTRDCCLFM